MNKCMSFILIILVKQKLINLSKFLIPTRSSLTCKFGVM